MFVALNVGVLTCVCAVRLATTKSVDVVIKFCFVASKSSVSVLVYVVD